MLLSVPHTAREPEPCGHLCLKCLSTSVCEKNCLQNVFTTECKQANLVELTEKSKKRKRISISRAIEWANSTLIHRTDKINIWDFLTFTKKKNARHFYQIIRQPTENKNMKKNDSRSSTRWGERKWYDMVFKTKHLKIHFFFISLLNMLPLSVSLHDIEIPKVS